MSHIYQAAIRTAVEASAAAASESDSERPMSSRMLEAALPHVMQRVFNEAGPPPSPKKKEKESA